MPDGSWMSGASHKKVQKATSKLAPVQELAEQVPLHKMPDGTMMPGVTHKQAMHQMPDGSWMRGASHPAAIPKTKKVATPVQELSLIEKAPTVKSNPAASAGVSRGAIISPKKLVKAVAPKQKKPTKKAFH